MIKFSDYITAWNQPSLKPRIRVTTQSYRSE